MRVSFVSAALVAALALGGAAGAAPQTFATFSSPSAGQDLRWVRNASGGQLFSIASSSSTVHGAAQVDFRFLAPVLAALGPLPATFTFDATAPLGNPAFAIAPFLVQTGLSGNFAFTYSGAAPLVVGKTIYMPGANLLSGSFGGAAIAGLAGASSGSLAGSTSGGTSIALDSDFVGVAAATQKDFTVTLTSVAATFAQPGAQAALRDFVATAGGAFSADSALILATIPEPESWALMIVGFGAVGLAMRSRKGASVAA